MIFYYVFVLTLFPRKSLKVIVEGMGGNSWVHIKHISTLVIDLSAAVACSS